MERDSFIFYRSFYEAMSGLKDKDKLQLFNAICELSLNGNDVKMSGICKNIFTAIRPQIVANSERYDNGKKGGRPKTKTNGFENKKTSGFENKKPNNNENENKNENVNENENNNRNVNDSCVDGLQKAGDSCIDGLQEIIDFYNNNIGLIPPYAIEVFQSYLEDFDKDVIIYAMQISVEANKRTIKYIKAILNNWKNAGIKTLIEAKQENNKTKKNSDEEEFLNEYR